MAAWIPRLLFLQILLCSLAALRGILPGCYSCGGVHPTDFATGLSGAIFYFVLWSHSTPASHRKFLSLGIGAAAGVHLILLFQMILQDSYCLWCLLAAGNCFFLTLLLLCQGRLFRKGLLIAAGIGLSSTALASFASSEKPPPSDSVSLTIYERGDCDYCWELRHHVIPALTKEFPATLNVRFQSANDHAWVERVPTIILETPLYREKIEGLPGIHQLRRKITRLQNQEQTP